MPKGFTEFLTNGRSAPDTFGESGCKLEGLGQVPIVVRHESRSSAGILA
jgi:hypothetical protein